MINTLVVPIKLIGNNTIDVALGTKIEVINVEPEHYEGDYIVTPSVHEEQVLATKQKFLTSDVTVLRVPYYETSNEYGTTIYIGGD